MLQTIFIVQSKQYFSIRTLFPHLYFIFPTNEWNIAQEYVKTGNNCEAEDAK